MKTMGDGALLEFPSPVEAVLCAVEAQTGIAEWVESQSGNQAVQLRMGINLGDIVITDDGDILGDSVNIAVRLESIADPGGVCISGKVFDELEGKLSLPFEDRGEQHLKNISRPVRVFALKGDAGASARGQITRSSQNIPDKPSIAVLPFANLSGDLEQEYFADGVVDNLITALARLRWLFVIARNSSFAYKGRNVDIRKVGRELGVRYVLEGSVRKRGDHVRITGQLIDAATGHHVWADTYQDSLENVFDVQDKLAGSVIAAVEPTLRAAEIIRAKAKPTDSLNAYDLYLRALPPLYSLTEHGLKQAEVLLREAVKFDPSYSDALAALARCIGRSALSGWVQDLLKADEEACEFARRAVVADPWNGEALAIGAWAYAVLAGRFEQALAWADQALHLHPNSMVVRQHCGSALSNGGESDKAIKQFEAALRMSPVDPQGYLTLTGLAAANFFSGNLDEAVSWARRSLDEWPSYVVTLRYLAAALSHLGRIEEAREVCAELLRRAPSASLTRAALSKFRTKQMLDLYVDGLRMAGLPE